jgi:hypothetical protein
MAITKETIVAKIEVVTPWKHLQVAYDTVIKEDGAEISRKRTREVFVCGRLLDDDSFVYTDMSSAATDVKAIADLLWTQAIKDAWKAKQVANKQEAP